MWIAVKTKYEWDLDDIIRAYKSEESSQKNDSESSKIASDNSQI